MEANNNIRCLTPRQAFEAAQNGALLIDIRERAFTAYKRFNVPEIKYLPLGELVESGNEIPNNRHLILADTSGLHVRQASEILLHQGYSNHSVLAGGIVEWERDGMPLLEDLNERLTGTCVCMLRPRDKK